MHIIHQGQEHPGQFFVVFLPMIDSYSGDKTCILSTLNFICDLAIKYHVPPIITFDQPLYWKAAEIIMDAPESSQLKSIVLMLGCFHTFMNLLGAIGTLMDGSGLRNIMEVAYGSNAVQHMMSGKSVQQAFREHLLMDRCINDLVVSDLGKIKDKLSTFKPFSLDPSLTNIVTGVVAKEDVNVHEFQTVGNEIIEKMVEKPIFGI